MKFYSPIIIILILLFNCQRVNNKEQKTEEAILKLTDSINNKVFLDTTKIISTEPVINVFKNKEKIIVYFFPFSACDVCEEDVFNEIKKNKKITSFTIVLVPLNSIRDFKRFNNEYNLSFNKIFGYKGEILKSQKSISRGFFFHLDKKMTVSEVFIPNKPIKKGELKVYIKEFLKQ